MNQKRIIHYSRPAMRNNGEPIFNTYQEFSGFSHSDIKPKGIWYECYNWRENRSYQKNLEIYGSYLYDEDIEEYLKYEEFYKKYDRDYELFLDYSNILVIDTYDKLLDFNKTYYDDSYKKIDWAFVSDHYDGIECCTNYYEIRNILDWRDNFAFNSSLWFSQLDIPSGCIWNENAVVNYSLIGERDREGKKIYDPVIEATKRDLDSYWENLKLNEYEQDKFIYNDADYELYGDELSFSPY